jgi:hypothetical protein
MQVKVVETAMTKLRVRISERDRPREHTERGLVIASVLTTAQTQRLMVQ